MVTEKGDISADPTTTTTTSSSNVARARGVKDLRFNDDDDDDDVVGQSEILAEERREAAVDRMLAIGFIGIASFLEDADLTVVEWCLTELESRMELTRRGGARALKNPGGLLRWMVRHRGGAP